MYDPHRILISYTAPDGSTTSATIQNLTVEQLASLCHLFSSGGFPAASAAVEKVWSEYNRTELNAVNKVLALGESH